jgi:hypothetical protein
MRNMVLSRVMSSSENDATGGMPEVDGASEGEELRKRGEVEMGVKLDIANDGEVGGLVKKSGR